MRAGAADPWWVDRIELVADLLGLVVRGRGRWLLLSSALVLLALLVIRAELG